MPEERDPVCGMFVDPVTAVWRHVYAGRTYFFCRPDCLEQFKADPARYMAPAQSMALERETVSGPSMKTEYTCPMHPEIVRDEPGACPICGMALEPRAGVGLEEEDNPELRDMTRRFWMAPV